MTTKNQESPTSVRTTDDDAVYMQRFQVAYDFPVHFTERLFDPENPVLRDTLARLEPKKRHRCLVFIDDGVLSARPTLKADIIAYADRHHERIDLVSRRLPKNWWT